MLKDALQKNLKGDPVIWSVIILLTLLSMAAVYSATGALAYRRTGGVAEVFLVKHSVLLFFGLGAMWLGHKVNYHNYARIARVGLYFSWFLLVLAFFVGTKTNEANRWLVIPIINQSIQPSDLAKLTLISYVANYLARKHKELDDLVKGVTPVLLHIGITIMLIAFTNFSTAFMLAATCGIVLFIGRMPLKIFGIMAVGLLIGISVAFTFGQRGATLVRRIEAFLSAKSVPYQAEQAFIAIANGKVFGTGPGNSYQKDFLPEAYSDFIYAIIVEEYGAIGGLLVLGLYMTLLYRGLITVSRSNNPYGGLLAAGLSFSLALQALLNMGVAVGLLPVTGQPLPWLSMGGTSLVFTGLSFGIILSVSRSEERNQNKLTKAKNLDRHERPAVA